MTDTIKISRELRPLLERIESFLSRHVCAAPSGKVATELHAELAALLATPPADAADMGGQAGEEVEVVAWVTTGGNPPRTRRAFNVNQVDAKVQYKNWLPHYLSVTTDELMTVAQHRRILAQHRQQAGKLVEALRQVRGYTDSPHVVGIIDEALADWEKTSCGK